MKILVTGSSGFIGYHLCKSLIEQDHIVYGVDNHNSYYDVKLKQHRASNLINKNFYFIESDINSLPKIDKKIDVVINLAAQAGVRASESYNHFYKHSNINGFNSICNFCLLNNIKKIIYASSSSVYEGAINNQFTEDSSSEINPQSIYGQSKLENEIHADYLSKTTDLSFIGLRFFSVYGPLGRPDMAYFSFTDAIKKNKNIYLNNNGAMFRDMTYIDDIVQGIIGSLSYITDCSYDKKNNIFNLGNNNPIKTLFLLNYLQKKLRKKAKIIQTKTSGESQFTNADISKAKKFLGYNPTVDFETGINEFLSWHKEYYRI